jgi:hypothetical protein
MLGLAIGSIADTAHVPLDLSIISVGRLRLVPCQPEMPPISELSAGAGEVSYIGGSANSFLSAAIALPNLSQSPCCIAF